MPKGQNTPTPTDKQKQALSRGTFNRPVKRGRKPKTPKEDPLRVEAAAAEETQRRLRREFYARQRGTM